MDATQLPSDDALTSWDWFCRRADANLLQQPDRGRTRFALDALPEPQRVKAILDLRDRVINGDFDASAEESEEWANSPEGQDAMRLVERFTLLGVTFKNWIIAALAIVLVGTLLAWWIQR